MGKKNAKGATTSKDQRTMQRLRKAMKELGKAYERGEKIAEKCPQGKHYGAKWVEAEAARRKINADTVRKLRQLVSPKEGFTPKQWKDLIALCTARKFPLGLSTVFRILPVPKKDDERDRFLREVVKNRWPRARVAAEIRRRYDSRRQGDRVPKVPDDVEDALVELAARAYHFRRWCLVFVDAAEALGKRAREKFLRGLDAELDQIRQEVKDRAKVKKR
jgi:hypothetical protein